jgi:hypothetical protein
MIDVSDQYENTVMLLIKSIHDSPMELVSLHQTFDDRIDEEASENSL